ncbi:MFS transporter [Actinomadura sp. NPDC048394]|uniref:MFS transporter n=1 Tax=Actinomadura sp. NPDC048394 TaxID=3158223 RepID=UPI0033FEAD5D
MSARGAHPRPGAELPPPPGGQGASEGRGWRAVAVVLVGAFMALLDTTVVTVALPTIRTGLHASSAGLEWVVSAYALALGLALVPAGRAGDRFGHKPVFIIGLAVFTLASVACGVSQNQAEIVTARAVQGLGAGTFYPAIAATIQLTFTGPARSKAFGALGATIGVSIALGPVLGGLIIAGGGARNGWRWVFLVNLVIGAIALPVAAKQLPRARSLVRRRFDPVGVVLLSAGLLLLLIPLVEGQERGWPAWCYACFGACAVTFALLAVWEARAERRGADPLLKPGLLAQTSFSAGAAFAVVYFAGFTSVFFTLSILWQEGLGRSALMTGLAVVPFSFGSLVSAAVSDKLSARMGRMVLVTGSVMVAAGLALAALVVHLDAPAPSGWTLAGPLLLAGLGSGMVIAPNQDFVLARVPAQDAGTASAILGTAQRVGSALGIAIIGTVLFGNLHFHPGPHAAAAAFSHGSQYALLANTALVLVALVLVIALPRRIPGTRA